MQPHLPSFLRDRRRLVNLSTHPSLQLKLPIGLLMVSTLFALAFAAHTQAAYGKLITAGFEDAFLSQLAAEIRFDYFVVSAALAMAWCFTTIVICLTVTHHFLGPIVALRRRIAHIKAGEYDLRAPIRANHPLRAVADELDALARSLSGEELNLLEEDADEVLETELICEEPDLTKEGEGYRTPNEATPWVGWYAGTATAQP